MPGVRPMIVGAAVVVGHARFLPAVGWAIDVSRSKFGQSLMLFKGGFRFRVTTGPWAGGLQGPIARQQRVLEQGQGMRIDGDVANFVTSWGVRGTTFAYYGPNLAGRFWQVVDLQRRSLVQVDFYGGNEDFGNALAEAHSMLNSMDVEAPL